VCVCVCVAYAIGSLACDTLVLRFRLARFAISILGPPRPGKERVFEIASQDPRMAMLRQLEQRFLAEVVSCSGNSVGWRLTERAVINLKSAQRLVQPQPAFKLREHLALEDLTTYEILAVLAGAGWHMHPAQWEQWTCSGVGAVACRHLRLGCLAMRYSCVSFALAWYDCAWVCARPEP